MYISLWILIPASIWFLAQWSALREAERQLLVIRTLFNNALKEKANGV